MNPTQLLGALGVLAGLLTSVEGTSAETAAQWALRFLGISANPSSMKGPNDDPSPGNLWMTGLSGQRPVALTTDGGYQWPVFEPNGKAVIAMRGGAIVRVPLNGDRHRVLHPVGQVKKLIGFDRKDSSRVMVLLSAEDGSSMPGALSLASGKTSAFRDGQQDLSLMAHLESQHRVYDKTAVFPKTMSDTSISGAQIEWADIHYADGESGPRNVSQCKPASCDQPSLSSDGLKVVFVKAGR